MKSLFVIMVRAHVLSYTGPLKSMPTKILPRKPGASPSELKTWKRLLPHFQDSDLAYLASLYRQFLDPGDAVPLKIGSNFFPSALLSPGKRRELLGLVRYEDIARRPRRYLKPAGTVRLTLNPMNGGIGSSIRRGAYLKRLWRELGRRGPAEQGAKGSDLHFEARLGGRKVKVSVSEAKILRALRESSRFARVTIEQLASSETERSVRRLFSSRNAYFRSGGPAPWGPKTSDQILKTHPRVRRSRTLVQAALPTVAENGRLTRERVAPGGHGQWGVRLLLRSLSPGFLKPGGPQVAAIYNEDGLNNSVDPLIVGWMVSEKVPVAMISTTKTHLDRKGGQIGVLKDSRGRFRKEILEEAQARASGQEKTFQEMGLTRGEAGGQCFNTNSVLFNYTVLVPFLKDLARAVGRERLAGLLGPKLIRNRKSGFIQLEGALGSCLLNLDGFLSTTEDPRVRRVLGEHGMLDPGGRTRFLRVLNVGPRLRTKFFTPIKTAFDFWLQYTSDLYRVDPASWELVPARPGHAPAISLSGDYEDVTTVLEAFGEPGGPDGRAGMIRLKSLKIRGRVHLAGARLEGRVEIENEGKGVLDLNGRETRTALGRPLTGPLRLKNVGIRAGKSGKLSWKRLFRSGRP